MGPAFTPEVQGILRTASEARVGQSFKCEVFDYEWNQFVEWWAPRIHAFVQSALGPYGTNPQPVILPMDDGFHISGANASFNIMTGQIQLATSLAGQPGVILEKLIHEMTHGALSKFPEGDPFYEEGFVDYSVWVMAHAPVWGVHRDATIKAAEDNIRNRRDRALSTGTDYDRKRWAGGFYAATAHGPYIVAALRMRKEEGKLVW